jgi:hypothetical protein
LVTRILLRKIEAAEALGMSVDHYERHVQPFVKTVIVGRLVLVSPAELERWAVERSRAVRS